ncbi:MAG: ROK family protein [Candidatus Aureabacteria bacterium]|nr:ROK family protein [Candidatus Auribacterota bacterium]
MFAAGIDIGGTYTKVAIISKKGKIAARSLFETKKFGRFDLWVDKSLSVIKALMELRNIKRNEFAGIGVGAPGHIDSVNGVILALVNIKGWNDVNLLDEFRMRINVPVFVDNDANMMALGEYAYGAARGTRNAVCITLGTGVGSGLILEGKLYRGSFMAGGEMGHMPINVNGPACACGGKACVEAYVGNKYIVRRLIRLFGRHPGSVLEKKFKGRFGEITPKDIAMAANKKDKLALKIWEDTGKYLGVCLAGVVNLLDPEIIVIGGGVAKAGKLVFNPVKKTVRQRVMQVYRHRVKIVPALLGNDGGIMGCAWQVFEKGRA